MIPSEHGGAAYVLREEQISMLRKLKLFLFDLDGTLYLGERLFPFTPALLREIRGRGGRYLFMTNNSSRSVKDYAARLCWLGIAAQEADFVTSSQAAVYYLNRHCAAATLYVCGTQSLKEELVRAGFGVTEKPEEAEGILMGFDTELTFQKLRDISYLLCTRDLPYFATNPDFVCPTEFGSVPDCGSVCEMLYRATGKRPVVLGKPEPIMPQLAMERVGCKPQQTAVIGDRLYTDIRCGICAGVRTVLVMSGETTPEMLESSADKPDVVLQSGAQLLEALRLA